MATPAGDEFSHVIDWTEAMEQCGDDEEFLRELLSDLRGEIDEQIVKMDEVLRVSSLCRSQFVLFFCETQILGFAFRVRIPSTTSPSC